MINGYTTTGRIVPSGNMLTWAQASTGLGVVYSNPFHAPIIAPWPEHEKPVYVDVFKVAGITPPKYALASNRGWKRFMAYALKRARSNHPHNARWKPIEAAYVAMQVANKLEGT